MSHTILLVDADEPTTVLQPTQPPAGHHCSAEGPAVVVEYLRVRVLSDTL